MAKVFHTFDDAVSCRLCGATHAKPHDNQWKICYNCFSAFSYSHPHDQSEDTFTVFVASRLVRTIIRGGNNQAFGRCEVISNQTPKYKGYQCGHFAATVRDGRKVCFSHSKATDPTYCGKATIDEYDVLTERLIYVCKRDERFAHAIRKALE